jgi:hypothetical protein
MYQVYGVASSVTMPISVGVSKVLHGQIIDCALGGLPFPFAVRGRAILDLQLFRIQY